MKTKRLKRILGITIRGLRLRSVYHFLYFFSVIIVTALPVLLVSISQTFLNDVSGKQQDVYGEFSDIYYLNGLKKEEGMCLTDSEIDELLEGFHYQEYGVIYHVKKLVLDQEQEKLIHIGYADSNAIRLGHIKLNDGRFPQSESEIALTTDAIFNMGINGIIGENVRIGYSIFELTGIIESYGTLWPKGDKQVLEKFYPVNAFVDEKTAEKLLHDSGVLDCQLLIQREPGYANQLGTSEDFYQNQNMQTVGRDSLFKLPDIFLLITYLGALVLFFSIHALSYESIRRRYHIYKLMGMQKANRMLTLFNEYFFLGLAGIVIGTVLSVTVYTIFVYFSKMEAAKVFLDYFLKTALYYSLFSFIIIIVSSVFVSFIFLREKSRESKKNINFKASSYYKKTNFFKLLHIEYKGNYKVMIVLLALLSVSAIQIEFSMIYKNMFENRTIYKVMNGKMPVDFDFELFASGQNTIPGDENTVYIEDSYEKDGVDEELMEHMQEDEVFKEIRKYKEHNKVRILLDGDKMDRYLDICDGKEDGKYSPIRPFGGAQQIFKYGSSLLVDSKIMGYSEDEILSLSDFVIDGEINLDKLKKGEEVIILAPSFKIDSIVDTGMATGMIMSYVQPDSEDAINNTIIKAGDTLKLTAVLTDKTINSAVDEKKLRAEFERKDKEVTVGAIIPYNIGWFEKTVTLNEPYCILTLNSAFDNLGYPANYNRVRIYANDKFEYSFVTNKVNSYLEKLPYMSLEDRRTNLQTYKILNSAIQTYCNVFLGLVISIVFICIVIQMFSKIKMNMKRYSLLRINGMGINRIILLWLVQVSFIGIASIIISIPVVYLIVERIFGFSHMLRFISIQDLAYPYILFMLIVFISIVPTIFYLKKSQIRENIY